MSEITELQVTYQTGVISGNFEEVRKSLEIKLSEYENLVYTADTVKVAKNDLATLRKLEKAIDDKRKEIKKTWNDPYAKFEELTKELISMIDKPISEIDSQLKEFENERIKQRLNWIDSEYDKIFNSELMEICPLEKFFDKKWKNATTTKKSITDAMNTKKAFIEQSVKAIKDAGKETYSKAMDIFKKNLDLSETLAWITQYNNQKTEILEKQRIAEQERIRKEEEERIRKEEQERIRKEEEEKQQQAKTKANRKIISKKQNVASSQGFGVATSEQGFNTQQEEKVVAFNEHVDGTSSVTTDKGNTYKTGFCGFQQEETSFVPQQGFAAQPQFSDPTSQGFNAQPQQGFIVGGFQQQDKTVTYTVQVKESAADALEGLLNTYGYMFTRKTEV